MNHIRITAAFCLLIAAASVVSSCGDTPAAAPAPPVPKWGVGGELVFDSYSVDVTSGFWRNTPDSTVRYRLVDDKATRDGRTNVRVFVSGSDSILIARMASGDAEMFLNRLVNPLLPLPRLWAPLPFVSQRDAKFLAIDSTVGAGQFSIRIKGDAVAHYAGNEEYSAPGLDRMTTSRTELVAGVSATVAVVALASLDMEATVWYVPATDIVSRSDIKMDVLTAASPDKTKSGTSLRLKQIVYPK